MKEKSENSILVAEKDRDLSSAVTASLSARGYAVRAVYDGAQAIKELGEREFSAVMIGEDLPRVSAEKVAGTLRGVPTVILSDKNSLFAALKDNFGFSAVLLKPFTEEELLSKLTAAVDGFFADKTEYKALTLYPARKFTVGKASFFITAEESDAMRELIEKETIETADKEVIDSLNAKLEKAGSPFLIYSTRTGGYGRTK